MIVESPVTILIASCLIVNTFVFLLFGYDKRQVHKNCWRVAERTLLLSSLAGPFGGLLGMRVFRHKTQKAKFFVIVPVFAVLQVLGAGVLVTGIM
jgi:uncharacterized membrane protein YsdA (DUF1294 family)